MRGERLGGQASRDALRQDAVAAGAEVRPDHSGVRALEPEAVMDRLEHAVGTAAGFEFRGIRKDRDVDRSGAGAVDLLAQPVLVGRRGCKHRRRVDVQGIRVQRGDRSVDDRPRLAAGHENERRGEGGRE